MKTNVQAERMEKILFLVDKNNFALKIDTNPSRDKIERIKKAIGRRKQLLEQTISHYKNTNKLPL